MDDQKTETKKLRLSRVLLVILILAAIAVLAVLVFIYHGKNSDSAVQLPPLSRPSGSSTPVTFPFPSQTPTTTAIQDYVQSLSANPPPTKVLNDKYGIFMDTSGDQVNHLLNGYSVTTKYQDDGIVSSGQYAGYHLLAAFKSADDPSGGYTYFFATKDYKTFILDTSTYPAYYEDPAAAFTDPNTDFNKAKIIGMAPIPGNFPATIDQGNFILIRNQADWTAAASGTIGLKSNTAGLTFYAEPINIPSGDASPQDPGYKNFLSVERKYVLTNTSILVQDQNGLAYDYTFLSKEEYGRSSQNSSSSPSYDFNFYKKNELTSTSQLYAEYGELFPIGCGQANLTYVLQNISADDLVPVASSNNGVALYTFKDPNHPINQEAYYSKVTLWKDEFGDINNNEPVPSYQSYVASNPVLVFQDPWGRWVALGEWQYQTGGGCGKPVIYLYPPKPTEVTVKFINPVRLSLDIPTYSSKWDVLANPGGSLRDLQPAATDCAKINYSVAGSEYAKNACGMGVYPYLYWEGQAFGSYPKTDKGWIVEKAGLSAFLDSKLTEIGLNDKEKNDMMAYWVPQLLLKNAPYYRLSFFQTQTMDSFIPMQVSPKPQTTIRVFLDWDTLTSLPANPPQPQVLIHVPRTGFTLVEWGGLKQ